MAIIHYPGYISKEKAAARYKVQVRTIHNWHKRKNPPDKKIVVIEIDGVVCVKDPTDLTPPPAGIALSALEWLPKFAERHKFNLDRLYESVIKGEITGVIFCDRICVVSNEPQVLDYITKYKRLRKKKVPRWMKNRTA